MKHLVLAFAALAAMALIGLNQGGGLVNAANPGATIKPLLGCPDLSGDGIVLSADITHVVLNYGHDSTETAYQFLDDLSADGIILSGDITIVVLNYGLECPLVDTQIAQATLAIINDPDGALLMACDVNTLAAHGYLRASQDVPGQGIHYMNFDYWDSVFSVLQPEGFVCQNGRLAAELYVVDGDSVGWGPFTPGTSPVHSIDIDTFCSASPCSWAAAEGWHAHANICLFHIGTPDGAATIAGSASTCEGFNGGNGTWVWDDGMGWMGHLWNFVPNENLVPDINDTTNGRFADCRPPFKSETCPM